MKKKSTLIAFYGGTFDPIHNGHVQSAIAIAKLVRLNKIILLPNGIPVHRNMPKTSIEDRINMIQLAISEIPENIFKIDYREVRDLMPSWTFNTFKNIRCEYGPYKPIGFILGQDSFLNLPNWYRGLELINFCHLIVCSRSKYICNPKLNKIHPDILHYLPCGLIYYALTPVWNISSSIIRLRCHFGMSCNGLIATSVQKYIFKKKLYSDK
ncbi:NAD(P)-dependent nicotinic acid mononucleotide adenylyltransferase [Wigglesworthia glossinidia endosymbiont of Glossina morsitans morsitans (Yale colony)]|uniref:Probable nicotinate-nucleotide adenylyltransferase n=1 Tax=Wigglesworthia glossinidia endosymbiont of Glossina morsitans morsitans (Yale colony) TaxID=1142511 RepID=H6Q5E3_WIGGL|nr:nicotinate-nucleotide adenylyltransferase [Wigglesworthia glossinidia]AFA41426.1 NAD(P)-dependent nicotinic acid mononucleotide adenylyltransferase [Wigglesworthia glossinidia endosymbiont of Glossina morsitans morsitans (Yale colony)]